jgi:transposase-like protein
MKGTRHSEEQIIAILKQGEAGLTTVELCRQHGITEQTYYRWKARSKSAVSRLMSRKTPAKPDAKSD